MLDLLLIKTMCQVHHIVAYSGYHLPHLADKVTNYGLPLSQTVQWPHVSVSKHGLWTEVQMLQFWESSAQPMNLLAYKYIERVNHQLSLSSVYIVICHMLWLYQKGATCYFNLVTFCYCDVHRSVVTWKAPTEKVTDHWSTTMFYWQYSGSLSTYGFSLTHKVNYRF